MLKRTVSLFNIETTFLSLTLFDIAIGHDELFLSLTLFDIAIGHDELLSLVHEKMTIFIMLGFLIEVFLTELLNLFTMFSIKISSSSSKLSISQYYFRSYHTIL